MQGLFCTRCKSLMPPGCERCRVCGNSMDGSVISTQSCLDGNAPSKKQNQPSVVDHVNKDAPYLPYEPRSCQLDIISDIRMALDEERHIIIESGTGTGKTITSLAGSLEHAKRTNKKIVYLTRTITQSDQVMRELGAINTIQPVSGIAITGRGKSCPLFRDEQGYENIPANVLSMMCEEKRQRSLKGQAGGCRYYDRLKTEIESIGAYCRQTFPTSEVLDRYCEKMGVCPYEAKKALMKDMDVVAAPYIHILNESIRDNLLANLDVADNTDRLLLIVDEAHNLIDAAREQESFRIDAKMLDAAIDECSTMRSPQVFLEVPLKTFLMYVKNCMRSLANEKLGLNQTEAITEGDFIEERLMSKFEMSRKELDSAIEKVIDLGEARTEILLEKGERRISDVQTIGEALKGWCSSGSQRYVRMIKTGQDGEYLSAACIDPYRISLFLNSLKGAVHMSGTLKPMDQYARVLGLKGNPRFREYPSPFPPENKSVIYVTDVTTKQTEMKKDPMMQQRIEKHIVNLCNSVDKNTLVFFTSYANMNKMRPYIERHVDKDLFWEESRNPRKTRDNLDRFRRGRNGVFFSVMGGSIAEGIDFPGDELCFAIIVGIPYPPPSIERNSMSDMFDARFGQGKGWVYTSEVPAIRKMQQAIGRLIRTETDRGMAVILDNRASRYQRQLGAKPSTDPAGDAARFFR